MEGWGLQIQSWLIKTQYLEDFIIMAKRLEYINLIASEEDFAGIFSCRYFVGMFSGYLAIFSWTYFWLSGTFHIILKSRLILLFPILVYYQSTLAGILLLIEGFLHSPLKNHFILLLLLSNLCPCPCNLNDLLL